MDGLDVERTSAEEIARLLDARELSCEDVAGAYLSRMAALNDGLNVFLHIDEERTLAQARALDTQGRSGIEGVPIAYKDLLCIRDVPTTAGSRVLEGYRPPYTASVVRRCDAGGPRRARQDQHGRVRDGLVDGELGLRPDAQSVGSRARPGRLERRLGGGRGRLDGAARRSAPTRAARSASRRPCAASSA